MIYVGASFVVVGGITMVITGVALDTHVQRNRPSGLALNRARLQPGGGIGLRF